MPSITAKRLAAAPDATIPELSLREQRAQTLAKARKVKSVKKDLADNPFRRRQPRVCCGSSVSRQDTFLARKDLRSVGLYPFAKGLPSAAQRSPVRPSSLPRLALRDWTALGRQALTALASDQGFKGLAKPGGELELAQRSPVHGSRGTRSPATGRTALILAQAQGLL
jgi:hypothetical protein